MHSTSYRTLNKPSHSQHATPSPTSYHIFNNCYTFNELPPIQQATTHSTSYCTFNELSRIQQAIAHSTSYHRTISQCSSSPEVPRWESRIEIKLKHKKCWCMHWYHPYIHAYIHTCIHIHRVEYIDTITTYTYIPIHIYSRIYIYIYIYVYI